MGVSDRSAAAILFHQVNVGIINEQGSCMVIDPSKIRRERQKSRKSLQSNAIRRVGGLYFDGRKDKTRNQIIKGDQFHSITETEEHIVLIREPDSEYLGHLKTSSGTILHLTRSILDFIDQNKIDTITLVAVGCDDTIVNTRLRGAFLDCLKNILISRCIGLYLYYTQMNCRSGIFWYI